MLNRMVALLNYSPFTLADEMKQDFVFWISKTLIACQDALLLSLNQYHPSYKARNLIFREVLPRHFGEISQRAPSLLPLAIKATEYKLRPKEDIFSGDLSKLWFDVAQQFSQFVFILFRPHY